ncbi:MAG: FAD-dependent oxidoreductase, partial [Brevundimonas sp.]
MRALRTIAVAGAGPAGLAAAIALARQGRDVVVHERFDAPAPVGAGFMLQPTGLAVMRALGLEAEIRALGQPLTHIVGRRHPTGDLVLDVSYAHLRRSEAALGVHRAALFEVLHRAALQSGVRFETGFTAVDADEGRLIASDGRRTPRFDLVVDATGARSLIAERRLGARRRALEFGALWATTPWPETPDFDPSALQQVYRAADKMIGVLPVGRRPDGPQPLATFFWSLKAADHLRWRDAGLEAWKAEVLAFWPACAPVLEAITTPDQLTL